VLSAVELRECRLGEPEGWHRDRVIAHYGEACWQRWTSMRPEDLDFAFPQGETKREQLLRLRTYLERFFAERPELKRVALSSHGGNLRSLIHASENAPTDPVPMPNCVLYKIEYDRSSKRWKFLGEV
jgi:broad specificity phosphatase PhoE